LVTFDGKTASFPNVPLSGFRARRDSKGGIFIGNPSIFVMQIDSRFRGNDESFLYNKYPAVAFPATFFHLSGYINKHAMNC